jgi:hypothetical protein
VPALAVLYNSRVGCKAKRRERIFFIESRECGMGMVHDIGN